MGGGFAEVAVGDAGEWGEAGGYVVQFGRGDGGGAEGGTISESASIKDRAEATDDALRAAIIQEADHVSFFAPNLVGQRFKRTSA